MAKAPRNPADLRALAGRSLDILSDLFIKAGGNTLQTINLIRSFFGLATQREAADLLGFGKDAAQRNRNLNDEIDRGTLTNSTIPLDSSLADPTGQGRRYRYIVGVKIADMWKTINLNSDSILTLEQIRNNALRTLNFWYERYPKLASFLETHGRDEILVVVKGVKRRY